MQAPRGAASQPALQDRVTKDGGADRHRGFTSRGSREGTRPRGTTGRARRGEGGEEARGGYARRGTTRGAVTRGDPRASSTRADRLAERCVRFRRLERLRGDVFAELTGNKREGFWKQTQAPNARARSPHAEQGGETTQEGDEAPLRAQAPSSSSSSSLQAPLQAPSPLQASLQAFEPQARPRYRGRRGRYLRRHRARATPDGRRQPRQARRRRRTQRTNGS